MDRTLIEHWNGIQWSVVPSPNANTDRNNRLRDVTALSANDVWAVGFYTDDLDLSEHSLTLHWDGSQWSIVPSPGVPGSYRHLLRGISAISANDIWAVGIMAGGTYSLHWDGAQWSVVLTPYFAGSEVIHSVKALSANEVWAVGDYFFSAHGETLFLHWDGHAWTQVPSPSPAEHLNRLLRVEATSATDVWAVGYMRNFAGPYLTLVERYSDPCSGRSPTPSPAATTTATHTPPAATPATATPTQIPAGTRTATATPCPMTFSDVRTTDYFYEPVRYLYCRGVISGYADGTFRPYNNTIRGQLAKLVVLGFGLTIYTPPTPTFNDVPSSQTFYQYIETAYHSNLVSGYQCGGPGEPCPGLYFRPGNDVTRGQLSKIVALAAGWPLLDPSSATFRDVPVGSPFFRYVETAYNRAIISGYNCGPTCLEFRPGSNATRGQICKIVYLAIVAP